jgi:hypothetical protein
MEFLIQNPLIEMIFGIVSVLGVILLGWSNLMVEPPKAAVAIAELDVWKRHKLRQYKKREKQAN